MRACGKAAKMACTAGFSMARARAAASRAARCSAMYWAVPPETTLTAQRWPPVQPRSRSASRCAKSRARCPEAGTRCGRRIAHEAQMFLDLKKQLHVARMRRMSSITDSKSGKPASASGDTAMAAAAPSGRMATGAGFAARKPGVRMRVAQVGALRWRAAGEFAGGNRGLDLADQRLGVGRSATWVRRMIAIWRPSSRSGQRPPLPAPWSSICQSRVSARMGDARGDIPGRARVRRADGRVSIASGVIFTIETQCVISARSRRTHRVGAIGILRLKFGQRLGCGAAQDHVEKVQNPAAVGKAQHGADLRRGGFARAVADRLIQQAGRIAWAEPSAARVISASASSVISAPSRPAIRRKRDHHLGFDPAQVEALAARQHRDRHLRISVVAKMNFTCGGGSSSVFNSALKALVDSMWTSSMM